MFARQKEQETSSRKATALIANRFVGRWGKKKLQEELKRQSLVSGDLALATKISRFVELVEKKPNEAITAQGGTDNDIYFILCGSVSIRVNEREIATRSECEHFGEMALISSTARRSASVIAVEECVLARLSAKCFEKLARTDPLLWKRLAVTLAQRLRERNRFHNQPRSKPVVFIGSSTKELRVASCLQKYLAAKPVVTRLWSEGVFEVSKTTIEDLLKTSSESDFAVIILGPDDIIASGGKKRFAPRDNVVFELGLFMGSLERGRTYIVCPDGIDIKIPTDLLGVTILLYSRKGNGTLSKRLLPVKRKLIDQIYNHGPR